MAHITVRYPDGTETEINPNRDYLRPVLIGSSEQCQIQVRGEGVLPIHAYLAPRSNHYGLLLAPGAAVLYNGRELSNDAPPTDGGDLDHFRWVLRDKFAFELAGAVITVRHSGG